jgi:hypothetical protein
MSGFPTEVEDVLRAAGWSPERRADVAGWTALFEQDGVRPHPAAIDFLREFGGLSIELGGPGVSMAKEPVAFDPALCDGEGDRFAEFGEELGRQLFPIGELAHGAYFLGIDENSEIYLVETWIGSFGAMPTALENLILGVKPTRLD